jgi:hypothetical protein
MKALLANSMDVVEGDLIIFGTRISHLRLEIRVAGLANSIPVVMKVKLER